MARTLGGDRLVSASGRGWTLVGRFPGTSQGWRWFDLCLR